VREPRDWDEEYILNNLPFGEFDWLEIKGSQVIKPESKEYERDLISKAISAFANSAGGTLVLGLKPSEKNWIIDDDGIVKSIGKTTTREWLEDIIPNLVEVPLMDFNVYELSGKDEKSHIDPDKAIFVIQVQDSVFAPHQASDKRYYGRIAGKSRPLGHQFVMDIFGRRRDPIIDLEFFYTFDKSININYLEIMMHNHGRIYANYVNAFVSIPETLVLEPSGQIDYFSGPDDLYGVKFVTFKKTNTRRDPVQIGITSPEFGPVRYEPILPGLCVNARIALSQSSSNLSLYFRDAKILWTVYADNAPPRKGEILSGNIKFLRE
jgi:hypothetical protein